MSLAGVTLETLKTAIQQTAMQAETLRQTYSDYTSGTGAVVDSVALELGHLYELVHNEIKTLKRSGDL